MNCQACGLPLTTYDVGKVSCKGGHVWTLPEFADQPVPTLEATAAAPTRRGARSRRLAPAWLPGAVLGAGALATEVIVRVF